MEERSSIIAVVNLVLRQDDKILLLQRANTGYGDGSYGMISGHVEKGENFTDALIREALEEAGITLQREHLRVVHIQNKFADEWTHERVHAYFLATTWGWTLHNAEPTRCTDLSWFAIKDLPSDMLGCTRDAIKHIEQWTFYSEFGR